MHLIALLFASLACAPPPGPTCTPTSATCSAGGSYEVCNQGEAWWYAFDVGERITCDEANCTDQVLAGIEQCVGLNIGPDDPIDDTGVEPPDTGVDPDPPDTGDGRPEEDPDEDPEDEPSDGNDGSSA